MDNKFQEMMEQMMTQMMMGMMQKTMEKMMTQMMGTPEVAPAEAAVPTPKTLSREDFLALEESKATDTGLTEVEPLDLVTSTEYPRTLVFNQSCSSDVWTINWINLKRNYPNVKYDSKSHGFRWNADRSAEFKQACRSFKVTTTLTDKDREAVKEYRKAKNQRMAEYYSKKAQD